MGRVRMAWLGLALGVIGLSACNADAVIPTGTGADLAMVAMPNEDLAVIPRDARLVEDLAMCAAMPLGISLRQKPLDVVFVVDNTASMRNALHDVELTFNGLTQLLDGTRIDYRFLVVSQFGDSTSGALCLPKPSTNNLCVAPINGPPKDGKRVSHYDLKVEPNRFDLLATYRRQDQWKLLPNGWGGWIRKDALKAMVFFSATGLTNTSAANFDFMARALDPAQFGNGKALAYRTFFIGGMTPPAGGLPPNAPVANVLCGVDAIAAGVEDQNLAILTGGWRWAVCDPINGTFKLLAQQLVNQVRTPCQAELEKPAMGKVDTDTLALQFLPGVGNPVDLVQVQNAGACVPNGFYLEGGYVVFCPAVCNQITADLAAQVTARACIGP